MSEHTTYIKANALLDKARAKALRLASAESCTGGLVAAALTEIPGSSDVFDRGFVTYSNAAKSDMLGVADALLEAHGAVSAEVARAMALGAIDHSLADVAVAVTGVAGPGGGSSEKPVGLVYFACARRDGGVDHVERRYGPLSRDEIRAASVIQALDMMIDAVDAAQRRP
ncbi:MAG: competence damage-inducible protein A [Methylocystaceae bacterium]|nr:MAG: competence damage-inducible protein A [Methylocystaceae bacterium]KAF0212076.1 MAG: competence damage-inducible protein [Methylocystaceae bacterium]TXT45110.1 MAG: competence damage-inducible protein A [Methylocystaceae bacterium]